jgi:hypothetical protein
MVDIEYSKIKREEEQQKIGTKIKPRLKEIVEHPELLEKLSPEERRRIGIILEESLSKKEKDELMKEKMKKLMEKIFPP